MKSRRLADHFSGKAHLAYLAIRKKLKELDSQPIPAPLSLVTLLILDAKSLRRATRTTTAIHTVVTAIVAAATAMEVAATTAAVGAAIVITVTVIVLFLTKPVNPLECSPHDPS